MVAARHSLFKESQLAADRIRKNRFKNETLATRVQLPSRYLRELSSLISFDGSILLPGTRSSVSGKAQPPYFDTQVRYSRLIVELSR